MTVSSETLLVPAKTATEAKIGPLQGVHTIPRAKPVMNPPPKSDRWLRPTPPKRPLKREIEASILRDSAGTAIETPMTRSTTTANLRRTLGLSPSVLSSAEIAKVKKAYEIATPAVMPSGRRLDLD